ncbi:MAG: hypothetical protein ACLP2Y_11045 [Limisphaerales bacterium]
MKLTRCNFLRATAVASVGAAAAPLLAQTTNPPAGSRSVTDEVLERTAAKPVLQSKGLKDPGHHRVR